MDFKADYEPVYKPKPPFMNKYAKLAHESFKSGWKAVCHMEPGGVKRTNLAMDISDMVTKLNALHKESEEADLERAQYMKDIAEIDQALQISEDALEMLEATEGGTTAEKKALKSNIAANKRDIKALQKKHDSVVRKRDKIKVPFRLTLMCDKREDHHNDIMKIFRRLKYDIVQESNLPVGDFVILINKKLHRPIERKKLNDEVGSVINGRLAKQTANMIHLLSDLNNQPHRIMLIVEKMRLQSEMTCECKNVPVATTRTKVHPTEELERILTEINIGYAKLMAQTVFADEASQAALKSKIQSSLETVNEYVLEKHQSMKPNSHETCRGDLLFLNSEEEAYDGLQLDRSRVIGAMINRGAINGFQTVTSESDQYTAFIILKEMLMLHKNGEMFMERYKDQPDFTVDRIKEAELALKGVPLKEYLESRMLPKVPEEKWHTEDVRDFAFTPQEREFVLQIAVLNTITVPYAMAIVDRWRSPDAFGDWLVSVDAQVAFDELAALLPPGDTRKFNYAKAKKMYNHWFGCHYEVDKKNKVIVVESTAEVADSDAEGEEDGEGDRETDPLGDVVEFDDI